MAKFKVIHLKKECIGCGACAAICPEFWEIDDEGLAQLKGDKLMEGKWELQLTTLDTKTCNQEAADACPVGIIQIKEEK